MKAYSLHNVNKLLYEDTQMPECPDGWAVIKVKAAGICSSDIPRIFTKGTYHFPTVPGHEFSGEVHYVSNERYSGLQGKRVGIFPLIPCMQCLQCGEKHYEMCEHYDYIGSRRDGGFAEFAAVPIWNVIELPDNVSFIEGAMMEPLAVGMHAARKGEIRNGDNVAVVGTGMIGICAGQWARTLGAKDVTVIGRNEMKREIVERCGLKYKICTDVGQMEQYDVVIEAVGSSSSINLALNGVTAGGRLVLMGNPTGDISLSQNSYWRILRKQLDVRGTWNSSYDGTSPSDWTDVTNALVRKEIIAAPLVSHIFEQERLMEGLRLMYEKKEPYCKVMTVWNQ